MRDHRGLVDDEERIGMEIVVQPKGRQVGSRLLAIDATMDRECRSTSIEREDLGSSPRRSQQHKFLPQRSQSLDKSCCERRLARAGGASEHHHRAVGRAVHHELGKHLGCLQLLAVGNLWGKSFTNAINQI